MPDLIIIYALKDPRTDAIRYVGRTKDLETRMAGHRNCVAKRGTPIRRWLVDLRQNGLAPVPEVIRRVPEDDAINAETVIISVYAKRHSLLNIYQARALSPEDLTKSIDELRDMRRRRAEKAAARRRENARLIAVTEQRNAEMVSRHVDGGLNLSELGRLYGLTSERVRQIVRRSGVTRVDSVRAKFRRIAREYDSLKSQAAA